MAIISPSTFDPLKQYVAVRLQQGVPIVDADWNEAEDVRRFELRAYLKWFVGDGVPEGNDGFRIFGTGLPNDFVISASGSPSTGPVPLDPLREAGRCLVDGLDVLITRAVLFRSQPLHESQPGAAALAAAWGVPIIPELGALGTPGGLPNGATIHIYLDVWERLVTPSEDPTLVLGGLGTESCARMRREWAVRWRATVTAPGVLVTPRVPEPGAPDYLPGHSYLALAMIPGPTGGVMPALTEDRITDVRPRGLLTPPATLIEDTLGVTSSTYRTGGGRPVTDLRSAVNALLRGELPGERERSDATGFPIALTQALILKSDGTKTIFYTNDFAANDQVAADLIDVHGNVVERQVITSGSRHFAPDAVLLPSGETVVVYRTEGTGAIVYKRGNFSALAAATEVTVATAAASSCFPLVRICGDKMAFFYQETTGLWTVRVRAIDGTDWLYARTINTFGGSNLKNHAYAIYRAASGEIWFSVGNGMSIELHRVRASDGVELEFMTVWTAPDSTQNPVTPFLYEVLDKQEVFLIWTSTTGGARYARFIDGGVEVPDITVGGGNWLSLSVVEDAAGTLWVYHQTTAGTLAAGPFDRVTGTWLQVREIPTVTPGVVTLPYAAMAPDRSTWVFWVAHGAYWQVAYRQVITAI